MIPRGGIILGSWTPGKPKVSPRRLSGRLGGRIRLRRDAKATYRLADLRTVGFKSRNVEGRTLRYLALLGDKSEIVRSGLAIEVHRPNGDILAAALGVNAHFQRILGFALEFDGQLILSLDDVLERKIVITVPLPQPFSVDAGRYRRLRVVVDVEAILFSCRSAGDLGCGSGRRRSRRLRSRLRRLRLRLRRWSRLLRWLLCWRGRLLRLLRGRFLGAGYEECERREQEDRHEKDFRFVHCAYLP